MALNFPNSPTNGQSYIDGSSGNRWVWDAANTAWISTSTFTQTVTVSSTQPGSPVVGQLWWNQDYGRLLVYYSDGSSTQWVDASPSDATGAVAYGVANAAFAKANTALANTSDVSFNGSLYIPSGNFGVGTSSPSQKLQVYNNSTDAVALVTGGSGRAGYLAVNSNDRNGLTGALTFFQYSGGTGEISNRSNAPLIFSANNAEAMRITSASNVGIGTASPSGRLDVASRGITKGSMPSGSIIQIESTTLTTTFTSSTVGSWFDITGMSVTITPTSSTSKILVLVNGTASGTSGTSGWAIKLVRGSTDISVGTSVSNRTPTSTQGSQPDANYPVPFSISHVDSPATTSPITYKLQGRLVASTFHFNRSQSDADNSGYYRSASSITVMEIAQ